MTMRMQIEIDLDEIDGKETSKLNGRPPQLVMREHLLKRGAIVLTHGDHSVTFSLRELEIAVAALRSCASSGPRPSPGAGSSG